MSANAIRPVHQPAACWLIDLPPYTVRNATLVPIRGGRQRDVYLLAPHTFDGGWYIEDANARGEHTDRDLSRDYRLLVWGATQYSEPIGPVDHRPPVLPTSYSDWRTVDNGGPVACHVYAERHCMQPSCRHGDVCTCGVWRVCLGYVNEELDPIDEQWFLYTPREGVLYVEDPDGKPAVWRGMPVAYSHDWPGLRLAVADTLGGGDPDDVDQLWRDVWMTVRGKVEVHLAAVRIGEGR